MNNLINQPTMTYGVISMKNPVGRARLDSLRRHITKDCNNAIRPKHIPGNRGYWHDRTASNYKRIKGTVGCTNAHRQCIKDKGVDTVVEDDVRFIGGEQALKCWEKAREFAAAKNIIMG